MEWNGGCVAADNFYDLNFEMFIVISKVHLHLMACGVSFSRSGWRQFNWLSNNQRNNTKRSISIFGRIFVWFSCARNRKCQREIKSLVGRCCDGSLWENRTCIMLLSELCVNRISQCRKYPLVIHISHGNNGTQPYTWCRPFSRYFRIHCRGSTRRKSIQIVLLGWLVRYSSCQLVFTHRMYSFARSITTTLERYWMLALMFTVDLRLSDGI